MASRVPGTVADARLSAAGRDVTGRTELEQSSMGAVVARRSTDA
jgi:hypothetical protein